jgi:hypothetical protein
VVAAWLEAGDVDEDAAGDAIKKIRAAGAAREAF